MDSEEEKTGKIHGTSLSSSITQPLIPWHRTNIGIFLTEKTAFLARNFYAKNTHTQSSPKRSRTSSHDDQYHVAERRFSGSLPLDLAWEILSRLPAKSIVRSRSVSKLWSSITTNPKFINSFPVLPSASSPCVLLIFQKGETLSVFSFPQHQNPIDPYSQVERYEVINPNDRHFSCSDSVHGLICFEYSKQLVIWNPTVRHFLTLPIPEEVQNSLIMRYVRGMLGYDPIQGKYKVLSFLTDAGVRVLTLGAQESWRMTQACPKHLPITDYGNGRCINGSLYYKATCCLTRKNAIMSFDLRFEKFNWIEFPMDDHSPGLMLPYEGRLALFNSMATGVEIWILEDAENMKWSFKHFLFPPSDKEWMSLDLKGVNDGGELVYTPRSLYESFRVVYFDPKRKSIRETTFEGIVCDLFRKLKGFGFGFLNDLDVFPNHIESLRSL